MQLLFREGFNCLDTGFPGAPGHVGDFLNFYLSNIVRFVFQNCFVFMPCQVIMGKTHLPACRVCKCCKFRHTCTLLHVWSWFTTVFQVVSEQTVCLVDGQDLCAWYGVCELLARALGTQDLKKYVLPCAPGDVGSFSSYYSSRLIATSACQCFFMFLQSKSAVKGFPALRL